MATATKTNNQISTTTTPAPALVNPVALVDPRTGKPLVSKQELETSRQVDALAAAFASAVQQAQGPSERAMLMGRAILALKHAITPEQMETVMALMNQPNGFKTDRDGRKHPPYGVEVVKECYISSLLAGLWPVNNEWNIIASQMYIARNGYERLFRSIPGITDVEPVPGTPKIADGMFQVRLGIRWKLHGQTNFLRDHEGKPGQVFTVQAGGTLDNLLGKCWRRAYKAAYEKATGSVFTHDDDSDLLEAPPVQQIGTGSKAQAVLAQIEAKNPSVDRSAKIHEARELIHKLGMSGEEWSQLCRRIMVPADLTKATPEGMETALETLRDLMAQGKAEADAEREAIQGEQ